MQPFRYERTRDPQQAVSRARAAGAHGEATSSSTRGQAAAQFIAGGTNVTDYMALGVLVPHALLDLNPWSAPEYGRIELSEERLRLGGLVRMGQAEDDPRIAARYPIIRDTLMLAASRQIRNMASLGGNLLQRTRCEYFRNPGFACNKREPGTGCGALDGINRQHAVLGVSRHCIAVYPGDFAQALIALDARIETSGVSGGRTLRVADLHRLPGETPHLETNLHPDEVITFIDVPAGPWTARSRYVKVRDRESYQFALASAAVALHLEGNRVREARIALGGVATVPWRAHEAEAVLRSQRLDETLAERAAQAAFSGASTRPQNAFKVPLGRRTLVRALIETQRMAV